MPQGTEARATEKPSSDELRALVHLAVGPIAPHDNVKSLISRAARVLGVSYRRAKSFWYSEIDHVRAEEVARLRAERDRLLELRLTRLRAEILETERLLEERRRVLNLEAAEAMARAEAHRCGQVDYTLIAPASA